MKSVLKTRTLAVALAYAMLAAWSLSAATAAPTARRVVAGYFHRTVRCPTCQKVGSSIEEAIRANFAAELADGRLEWRMIDFQDPRNAKLVTAFGITGPAFIIMEVRDNRIVAWKPAPKAWGLVGDRAALSGYVRAEVRSVLDGEATAAR